MNVYILDEDWSDERRSWAKMITDVIELSWDNGKQSLIPQTPARGSILVCHRLSDGAFKSISTLATQGIFAVVVSGSHGIGREEPQNFYHRGGAVGAGCDRWFSGLFSSFRTALERDGTPQWTLLEGAPPPDAVLAYHLLCLLPNDPDARGAREKLREPAMTEAEAIANATGIERLRDIKDEKNRRTFLKACS